MGECQVRSIGIEGPTDLEIKMATTKALSDTARRTWRTFIQAVLFLAGVFPALIEAVKALGADVFGIDSVEYGKIVAIGAIASVVFAAFVRFYLAVEKQFPALEIVRKQNDPDTAVAVVDVSGGAVQDVEVVSKDTIVKESTTPVVTSIPTDNTTND